MREPSEGGSWNALNVHQILLPLIMKEKGSFNSLLLVQLTCSCVVVHVRVRVRVPVRVRVGLRVVRNYARMNECNVTECTYNAGGQ